MRAKWIVTSTFMRKDWRHNPLGTDDLAYSKRCINLKNPKMYMEYPYERVKILYCGGWVFHNLEITKLSQRSNLALIPLGLSDYTLRIYTSSQTNCASLSLFWGFTCLVIWLLDLTGWFCEFFFEILVQTICVVLSSSYVSYKPSYLNYHNISINCFANTLFLHSVANVLRPTPSTTKGKTILTV